MQPWDLFISHASEDKKTVVDPLAHRLKELAVRVWYDKFVLEPGDRLSERIAEGLANCRCGLLVLSKSFFGKNWGAYELSGLINRFVEEKTRLIPLWVGVTRKEVSSFNPALADLLAIKCDETNINATALEILRVVRPQLHENLSMLAGIEMGLWSVTIGKRPASELKDGPIRQHDLPASLLVRIQNIWFALRDVLSISLEKSIENFQRDLRPEREVAIFERIVSALNIALDLLQTRDDAARVAVFRMLLSFSVGDHESVFEATESGKLSRNMTTAAAAAWLNAIPKITVTDVEDDIG